MKEPNEMRQAVREARDARRTKMTATERDLERLQDLFDYVVATLTSAEGRSEIVVTDKLITPAVVRAIVEQAITKVERRALDVLRDQVAAGRIDPWSLRDDPS